MLSNLVKSISTTNNTTILFDSIHGNLSKINNFEGLVNSWKDTHWRKSYAFDFFDLKMNQGPILVWKDNKEKYLFHFRSMYFIDSDSHILPVDKFIYFRDKHPVLNHLFKDQLKSVYPHKYETLSYIEKIVKGRCYDAEPFILKDPSYCYSYCKNVLKERWGDAEPIICTDPFSAY